MLKKVAFAAAFAALAATGAQAGTLTNNLGVSVDIQPTCSAVAPTALNFGTPGGLPVNIDVATTIVVTCTNGTPYSLGLGAGLGAGATVSSRLLTGPGGATLTYSLSHVNYGNTNWDSLTTPGGSFPTPVYGQAGSGTHNVFGRLNNQTVTTPGLYSDTVVVTLSW